MYTGGRMEGLIEAAKIATESLLPLQAVSTMGSDPTMYSSARAFCRQQPPQAPRLRAA